jgi:hypothetical protein
MKPSNRRKNFGIHQQDANRKKKSAWAVKKVEIRGPANHRIPGETEVGGRLKKWCCLR